MFLVWRYNRKIITIYYLLVDQPFTFDLYALCMSS